MTANICEKMKSFIFFFLIFFSVSASAQHVSGLYSGTLTNDSLKMIQNYELALSEYKGKITGYSYITFVANDTFYYGIKRVKATRQGGELVVEDVEMLANNYPKRPDKGVHVINRIPLPAGLDTLRDASGKWETTKTKKFYSISGAMSLRKDDDSTHSALIAHLKELEVINYQNEKKDAENIAKKQKKETKNEVAISGKTVAVNNKPREAIANEKAVTNATVAGNTKSSELQKTLAAEPQKQMVKETVSAKQQNSETAPSNQIKPKEAATKQTPTEINNQTAIAKASSAKPADIVETKTTVENKTVTQSNNILSAKPKPGVTEPTKNPTTQTSVNTASTTNVALSKPGEKPKEVSTNEMTQTAAVTAVSKGQKPLAVAKTEEQSKPKEISANQVTQTVAVNTTPKEQKSTTQTVVIAKEKAEEVKSQLGISAIPSVLEKRTSNTIQTITVASDSLVLSFYDNGVVDGDSISVYVNNENVISKVKLKEAAVKKTIYLPTNLPETKLTLVAENLGSIPPNTGLLVIQDGNDRYQIRFSADMETNASVIIKKKR